MASKLVYSSLAALGLAATAGLAWWLQQPRASALPVATTSTGMTAAASGSSAAGRPPAVEVAPVRQMPLTDTAQAVGNLRSRQAVVLRPEVGGRITALNFSDGARVRQGQLLVQLDDRLSRAQVQQSQAELSIAQGNHRRNQELVAQGFISQRSVDESAANVQVAQAKLALAQASAARLQIVAPFDGTTGIRNVHVGDYLKEGADIVNLEDIDALYVDFRLPERYQSKLAAGQQVGVQVDAVAGQTFAALVQAIDPLLDANGRSVAVRACIDNRKQQLRPGMFARVEVVFGERADALVVPEEALLPQGQRQFVLRLKPQPEGAQGWLAERLEIIIGARRPGLVQVFGPLQVGDQVVTAGQQRVTRDGMAVRIVQLPAAGAGATQASAPTAPNAAGGTAMSGAGAALLTPPGATAAGNPCHVGAARRAHVAQLPAQGL